MSPFSKLIHPEGWRFVAIFASITLLLSLFSHTLGWIGGILTAWCFYFFRNPVRVTPTREGLIISPADGKIVAIKEIVPPSEWEMGEEPRTRISVFLNVFDVHINRIPISGRIRKAIYHPGKFFNASLDKASEFNERNTLVIDLQNGGDLAVVQIAGLIARRIRCDVSRDDTVITGSQYGIIRFGSRTDIYLPIGAAPLVIEGQRVLGGETVIADLESNEMARHGSVI
jgi:phosphatidylserine decarboxylase